MRVMVRVPKAGEIRGFGALAMACVAVVGVIAGSWLVSVSVSAAAPCPNVLFRTSASAGLPDCRAYEQVSPADKGGFAAYPASSPPAQLASSGEALAYLNYQAFPGAVGNTALFAAHVSTRTSGNWRTEEWTPRVPKAEVLKIYKVDYSFSGDLSQAVIRVPLIPLVSGATPFMENLFLRGPQSGSEPVYSLVNSTLPRVLPQEVCPAEELAVCWEGVDVSAYAGASSDFSHVLFQSNAQFATENVAETSGESLYESTHGKVRLVGILPDGQPAAGSTLGAGSASYLSSSEQETDGSVERAVSQDGSLVVFQAPADGGEPGDPAQAGMTEVYDRVGGTESVLLSAPAPGATPAVGTAEPARFQTASVDGSRVFFTSSAELTTPSNTGVANNSEDLYEYDLGSEQLTDLTVDTNPADATTGAMVQGVVDSSSDGSYVYFVANGQFVEGKGVDGQPNLYMVHNGGAPVFIATLSSTGVCNFSGNKSADACVWSSFPAVREAYVAPDGRHMAFMSTRSLPTVNFPGGYDNVDQETGKVDSEVYEYTAPTRPGGTGQLLCASCDPSGTRPVGNALIGGISPTGSGNGGNVGVAGVSTPFYRVRALSDDGRRLFYAVPASLEAHNSVLEYEQNGAGSCETALGCQKLISSPGNTEADLFLGSSADGNNVFFATSSRLALTDSDNLRDVYDARVDGGIAPSMVEAPCEGGCHEPSPPPATHGHVSGAVGPSGNVSAPPKAPPPKCKKGFKHSHGKCVKVKKKHRKHSKRKAKASRESRRAR
jgi:hypothetical protein